MRTGEEVVEATEPNPTLARRRLAVRFQKLREQNGRGLDDLATFLGVAMPQASRLDTGARGFQRRHVEKLADWYGLTNSERADMFALVAESRKRAWWQQVDLFDSYRTLIGMEQAAESINEYGVTVVPGLLQTREYARAAAAGYDNEFEDHLIEQAVQVRMQRQRLLSDVDSPQLRVVIDEAVLARTTGGRDVMIEQLKHLEEASIQPDVSVQVVGFERGVYLGSAKGHFILLGMGDELPDVLYQDGIQAPVDTSEAEPLENYWKAWHRLRDIALTSYESRVRIVHYRSQLESDQ
jgi:transcriptional regulator with XRE-family HTH domain